MTFKEAKDVINNSYIRFSRCNGKVLFLEAMRKADEAINKQIPMEHHHTKVGTTTGEKARVSICPACLGCIITVADEFPRFCTWCGQAIDWSDK